MVGAEDRLPWAPPGNCWPEVKLTCLQAVMSWMPTAPVQGNHNLCFLEQFFLFCIDAKKKKKNDLTKLRVYQNLTIHLNRD